MLDAIAANGLPVAFSRRMTPSRILAGLMLLGLAHAQDSIPAFQRVSGLPHAVVLRRIPVEDPWDLVAALASAQPCEPAPRPCWWKPAPRPIGTRPTRFNDGDLACDTGMRLPPQPR